MGAAATIPDDVVMTDAEREERARLSAACGVPVYGPTPRRFSILAPVGSERWKSSTARMPRPAALPRRSAAAWKADEVHRERFGHHPIGADGWPCAPTKCARCAAAKGPKVKRPSSPKVAKVETVTRAAETVPAPVVELRPTIKETTNVTTTTNGDRIAEYLARLIHEPKRDYAVRLVAHRLEGAPAPEDPGTPWAAKVRAKVDRMVAS